ncbi:MAG: MATE family efflux transporter [Lachnospiraceae bacterium]|nr:MATE family efflux transporter [Lachnospiraceae bacterium]
MREQQSVWKEYVKYASLNIMGMIGLSCYILADTFFISKGLGVNGLTALNLAIPVYSFLHGCGLMLGMGGSTKYSIYKGQRDVSASDRIFTNAVCFAAVLAVLFVCAGIFLSHTITGLLGADAEVADMTNTYLKVILMFSPAFLMNNILICFVRNDGGPKRSMLAMLGGSFSNILLDYIFIFPLHMGIFGAVLATGLAPFISMLILSGHFLKKRNAFHLKKETPQLAVIGNILSLGVPSLVTEVSSGIVILVFNNLILKLDGNVGVAAYGVVANLSLVVVSIYTGIAQGIQPIISREYGKGDHIRIRKTLRYGMTTMLVLSVIIYLLLFVFADEVTGIFNSEGNAKLRQIAVSGLRWYFLAVPFVGFNIVIASYFTSVERAVPAQWIALARGLFLIIPMAFVLSALAGLTGVWLAFPVTEAVVCISALFYFAGKRR